MGDVVDFRRSERRYQTRRTARLLAHLNGFLVELTDLSLSGLRGGSVELLSYADIGLEVGDHAELRLPRPGAAEGEIDFSSATTFSAPILVEVIRRSSGTRSFGARFANLSQPQVDLIEELMLRGSV